MSQMEDLLEEFDELSHLTMEKIVQLQESLEELAEELEDEEDDEEDDEEEE